MPVSTKRQGRDTPRTVSHETVIRRSGTAPPTVKFNVDDTGNVIATSIRIASRDASFGATSKPTRNVNVPLRPQAPRTVAFASGADHPAPDAGTPNFDVDLTSIRLVSSATREIAPNAAIRLDIVSAPSVAAHERPVWRHECSVCRDEWELKNPVQACANATPDHDAATCVQCIAALEIPVLSGICTGHPAATCSECVEAHAVKVARAEKALVKAQTALSGAKTPKQYLRAEKRVNLWNSRLSNIGAAPSGMCPRHDVKPADEIAAIERRAAPREHKRTGGDLASTLYATLYGARPSWERDALSEGIAAGITVAPDPATIQRATITEPAPRETVTHDAYALRGVGVVATDETYHARVVAERWRGQARATDKVCAVCRRMECPSVRRTGRPCVASEVRTTAAPSAPSTAPAKGVYVAPSSVSAHGLRGGTYRAPEETLPKPRVAPARVESPAVTARRIEGERTTPERAHGPYEIAPRGRIVR